MTENVEMVEMVGKKWEITRSLLTFMSIRSCQFMQYLHYAECILWAGKLTRNMFLFGWVIFVYKYWIAQRSDICYLVLCGWGLWAWFWTGNFTAEFMAVAIWKLRGKRNYPRGFGFFFFWFFFLLFCFFLKICLFLLHFFASWLGEG